MGRGDIREDINKHQRLGPSKKRAKDKQRKERMRYTLISHNIKTTDRSNK